MLSLFCTRPRDPITQAKEQTVMSLKRNLLYRVMEDNCNIFIAYGKSLLPQETLQYSNLETPRI
jgi:hypothetical protein